MSGGTGSATFFSSNESWTDLLAPSAMVVDFSLLTGHEQNKKREIRLASLYRCRVGGAGFSKKERERAKKGSEGRFPPFLLGSFQVVFSSIQFRSGFDFSFTRKRMAALTGLSTRLWLDKRSGGSPTTTYYLLLLLLLLRLLLLLLLLLLLGPPWPKSHFQNTWLPHRFQVRTKIRTVGSIL